MNIFKRTNDNNDNDIDNCIFNARDYSHKHKINEYSIKKYFSYFQNNCNSKQTKNFLKESVIESFKQVYGGYIGGKVFNINLFKQILIDYSKYSKTQDKVQCDIFCGNYINSSSDMEELVKKENDKKCKKINTELTDFLQKTNLPYKSSYYADDLYCSVFIEKI